MSTQNTIANLSQALQCAGKCDCCDKLQSQINSLNQKINQIETKFVPKQEFESYKQYVEKNFDAISQVTRYLVNEVKRFTEAKYQELGYTIKDAISDFHRDMDAIRGKINELIGKPESKPPLPDLSKFERKDTEHDSRLSQLSRELNALRELIKDWQGSDKAIHEMKSRIAILERALESEKVKRESVDKELREAQERNKNSLMVELEKRLQAERQARGSKDIDLEKQIDIIEDILKNRGENKTDLSHLERQLGILKNALEAERKKRELMDGYLSQKLETVDDDWQRQLNQKLKEEEGKRNAKDNQLDSTDRKILLDIAELRKKLPLERRVAALEKQVDKIWGDLRIKTAEIAQIRIGLGTIQSFIKTGLPALIKSIVWSIILSAAFNAVIAGIMGAFNTKLAQDAWDLALKAFGVAKKAEGDAAKGFGVAKEANDKADIAISRIDGLKKEVDGIVANALAAMQRLENEIKFVTESARRAMLRLQDRIANLETYTGELSKIIGNQWAEISNLSARITDLTTFVNNQIGNIQKTVTQFKTDLLTEFSKLQKQIPEILGKIALFAAQIAGILLTIAGIQALLSKLKPGGNVIVNNNNFVTNNFVTNNNTSNNQTTVIQQSQPTDLSWLRTQLNRIEGIGQSNLALSSLMNLKLGNQIKDGLSGWMNRFSQWDIVNRAVNYMTLAATIHNAVQLSSSLTTTLISSMQNIVSFAELKDSEGTEYNISELIRGSITSLISGVIGAENFAALSAAWKAANRIYQSAGNLFSSLLNMGDTMTQALTVIGGQTGKIGNALRAWGVVSENAYGWMNPSPNFNNPVLTKLQSLNDTASIVETVSTQPLTVKSAKEELEEASAQLQKDIAQLPGEKISITIPEASKVKESQDNSKLVSKSPEISSNDLEADE